MSPPRHHRSGRRRRLAATVACASVAVIGLSACGPSTPSDRRIALDIIDGLPADLLTDDARACMTAYVEGLSNDRLDAIVRASKNSQIDEDGYVIDPPAELAEFQDALVACREGVVVTTTVAGDAPETTTPDTTAA